MAEVGGHERMDRTEGRVTMMDGILAVAVLASLVLNAALG